MYLCVTARERRKLIHSPGPWGEGPSFANSELHCWLFLWRCNLDLFFVGLWAVFVLLNKVRRLNSGLGEIRYVWQCTHVVGTQIWKARPCDCSKTCSALSSIFFLNFQALNFTFEIWLAVQVSELSYKSLTLMSPFQVSNTRTFNEQSPSG